MTEPHVTRNDRRHQYEVEVDGSQVGFARFRESAGRIVFTHTVVDDAVEGQGVGSRLVAEALDDAVERGLTIVPVCPFVAAYLRRHSEYDDHVEWPQPNEQADDRSDEPDAKANATK